MTIFDPARTRVIDAGGPGGGILRLIGFGIIAFVLVILLFSSVTRVGTGHVGVLTLFGRVTNETLGEGIHLINPLKTNNEMSIQTQTLKESASVPSSEGLMMSLDTSLIYHLTPDRAAEVFQKIGADRERRGRADAALGHPRSYRLAQRQRSLHRRTRNGGQTDIRTS